jgi:hypothetical protein
MKYLLLIYANPTSWIHPVFMYPPENLSKSELDGLKKEDDALLKEIRESGELIGGRPLAEPAISKTVRIRDGVLQVTDGPFAESKEQLAGYVVVECESIERAVEIASRYPDVRWGALEVRPILDLTGLEM